MNPSHSNIPLHFDADIAAPPSLAIPVSYVNHLHLLLREVIREASEGRVRIHRLADRPEIEKRLAVIQRNAEAMRSLLPDTGTRR